MATPPKLPKLGFIDRSNPPTFAAPKKCIHETPDVAHFLRSQAYRDIGLFLMQLNRSVCPRHNPSSPVPIRFPLSSKLQPSPSVAALQKLLARIEAVIEEAPPVPGPQRFGNVSFRTWHEKLGERVPGWLAESGLGEAFQMGNGALSEAQAYLLGGFGSAQRIDYGTGHELSFIAFLGCLWKLGYFTTEEKHDGAIEREIVLQIIQPYLVLVRKLIMTYNLEPAGTHGVWGLDDHSFAPYIFGSAQLTRPINDDEAMPLEGSVRGAPKTGDITKPVVVDDERQTNMYFSAIGFINDIKKGPFWEHSPMLFDISGVKDGWGKINKGMIKMYNAEVLSKFPVVQHFPFGSMFSWDLDPDSEPLGGPSSAASTPTHSASATPPPGGPGGTAAPWAQPGRMPPPTMMPPGMAPGRMPPGGMPPTGAPWAQSRPGQAPPPPPPSAGDGPTKAPWAK